MGRKSVETCSLIVGIPDIQNKGFREIGLVQSYFKSNKNEPLDDENFEILDFKETITATKFHKISHGLERIWEIITLIKSLLFNMKALNVTLTFNDFGSLFNVPCTLR